MKPKFFLNSHKDIKTGRRKDKKTERQIFLRCRRTYILNECKVYKGEHGISGEIKLKNVQPPHLPSLKKILQGGVYTQMNRGRGEGGGYLNRNLIYFNTN